VAGSKVSVNDCVIRAVALAMKKVPAANASWTNDAIMLLQKYRYFDCGCNANGLVTPIIKKADTKTFGANLS